MLADQLNAVALQTHALEELGIDPGALGRPLEAAASSFLAFALGALVPLLPWLFTSGATALVISIVLSGLAALAVGYTLGVFTGRSRWRSERVRRCYNRSRSP